MEQLEPRIPLPSENVFGHRKKLDFLRGKISEFVKSHPGRDVRVLDVGCSNGQYVSIHLGDLGAKILSVDPHTEAIEYAKSHNPYPESIEFRDVTVEQIPENEKFDIVVMADVLEHLDDPGTLLKSAKDRLAPDGIIIGSIPNGYGPFEIENALDRRGCLKPSYWLFNLLSSIKGALTGRTRKVTEDVEELPYAYDCGHVQFFTISKFTKLVESVGLKISEWKKGPWIGALCTSTWWGRSEKFCRFNTRMGDIKPFWAISAWYFEIGIIQ